MVTKNTQKIGILADTHGSLPQGAYAALANCDYLVHAGDIGAQHVIDELETIAPVTAVLGNCDYPEYVTQTGSVATWAQFEKSGVCFLIAHKPKDLMATLRSKGILQSVASAPECVGIHGHTHRAHIQKTGRLTVLCPGSPTHPREGDKPSVAVVTVEDGSVKDTELIEL
ncbi:MAG: metallophosphatase family protein [Coriobacteriales bacterium]|jgi:putative phosphoesterase|nr:metallophosphatase family protein [Coriobacteriales bacterium]